MYTLGGGIDTERGWGRAGETWAVRDELAAYGADPSWFGLGDRDTATHLVRTRMLRAGYPLSDVTAALCHRWQPGVRAAAGDRRPGRDARGDRRPGDRAAGAQGHPLPGVVDPAQGRAGPARLRLHRRRAGHRAAGRAGTRSARADAVLLAPSNPVVSIGALLDVPGAARRAARRPRRRVVGLSPIVGGRPLRGMADACLAAIGVRVHRGGGRAALRRARRGRPARRLAGAHRRRRRRARGRGPRRCRC